MELMPHQLDYVKSGKKINNMFARLGKTIATYYAILEQNEDANIIIITTKSVVTSTNLGGNFAKDLKLVEDKLGIPNKKIYQFPFKNTKKGKLEEEEFRKNGGHLITNHHFSNIEKLIDYVDKDTMTLLIDEVHKLKNPGEFKGKAKKLVGGKAGFNVNLLSNKCKDTYMLSATLSGVKGYIDYANYFIMTGDYMSRSDFEEQHVVWGINQIATMKTGFPVKEIAGYKNEAKIKALIDKYVYTKSRDDEDIIEFLGEFPEQEYMFVPESTKFKTIMRTGVYKIDGEEHYVNPDSWREKLLHHYDGLNEKNDKIQAVLDLYETDGRLCVFYSSSEDARTMIKAFEKKGIKVFIKCGDDSIKGRDTEVFTDERAKEEEKWILLGQYDAMSEGITLVHLCSTLIHYSIPVKYETFTQASSRCDGRKEESYGDKVNYILLSPKEYDIYKVLSTGQDYDTISNPLFD